MKFTLYTQFTNLEDFKNGLPINCSPSPRSDHDILFTVDLKKVNILTNQSGIYIERMTFKKKLKRLFKKR